MLLHNRISWFKQYNVNSPADAQLQPQTHVEASHADSYTRWSRWGYPCKLNELQYSQSFKKIDR